MRRLLTLSLTLLVCACATAPSSSPRVVAPMTVATATAADPAPATGAAPTPVAPLRADDNLDAVAWTQAAIEHDLIYREVYRDAQQGLLHALHDPHWDALAHGERDHPSQGLPAAVVLDIDETVLDNSPYQARLVRDGGEYDDASWADWVREKRARAMPGAVAFTRFAAAHGIAVIYISNRDKTLDAATVANLREQGFPVSGPQAFLGKGTQVADCSQRSASQKSCRRRLIGRHYRVLMQVGDQLGDFVGVPENTVAARKATVQPYLDWFGERWFILPNPTYGDWQPALFGNDWKQSRQQRRRATHQALRYN